MLIVTSCINLQAKLEKLALASLLYGKTMWKKLNKISLLQDRFKKKKDYMA